MKHNILDYHSDTEYLQNSISIYRISLFGHVNSKQYNKRSLLFLYLYGYRHITRRQIYLLLSYNQYSNKDIVKAEEYIGKFVRGGLLTRGTYNNDCPDDQAFSLTKKGISIGRDYFTGELKSILKRRDVYYSQSLKGLLYDEEENIEEYADIYEKYANKRYKDKRNATVHQLSVMDSLIFCLMNLKQATVKKHSTEVKFYQGEVCEEDQTIITSNSDVRSDAVLQLALDGRFSVTSAAEAYNKAPYHLVCIEQDTGRQNAAVLTDKISRYANLIAFPRIERYGIPPTLIFTLLPRNREGKKQTGTGVRKPDLGVIHDIELCAILYAKSHDVLPEKVTVYQLYSYLRAVCYENPQFNHIREYLKDKIYTYDTPALELGAVMSQYSDEYDEEVGYNEYKHKLELSYRHRKRTVFAAAAAVPGIDVAARAGFSVCTANNYDLSTLPSLFPDICCVEQVLEQIFDRRYGLSGKRATYRPFYTYKCSNGESITFRNAYEIDDQLFFMENISEDYCARLRLEALCSNGYGENVVFIALISVDNSNSDYRYLDSLADRIKNNLFVSHYNASEDGGIFFRSGFYFF